MGNKIFNDSQMEKVHGAGVGNYIEGGLKIAASAGLATLSLGNFVMGARCGNLVRRAEMENYDDTATVDYVRHLSHSSFTRGTIETALAAFSI